VSVDLHHHCPTLASVGCIFNWWKARGEDGITVSFINSFCNAALTVFRRINLGLPAADCSLCCDSNYNEG
jgi:hypothetical protein